MCSSRKTLIRRRSLFHMMTDSMAEYLRRDMECEGLLECVHGLTDLDRECYRVLVETDEPLNVDEVSEKVDRERSTVYRSIQRLMRAGFVRKDQVNYEDGGYYYVYYPADVEEVTDEMRKVLNEWYATIGQLIHEFESKYGEEADAVAAKE